MVLVAQGAADAARILGDYLRKMYDYEKKLAVWRQKSTNAQAIATRHQQDQARYLAQIQTFNIDRSLGTPVGGRPVSPGLAPPPFKEAKPAAPAAPADLHVTVFHNAEHRLPRARPGARYWEIRVMNGRAGRAGQHRVVVLFGDDTGMVEAKYCSIDHYGTGQSSRATLPSFSRF
jgi:hypothetical protein